MYLNSNINIYIYIISSINNENGERPFIKIKTNKKKINSKIRENKNIFYPSGR